MTTTTRQPDGKTAPKQPRPLVLEAHVFRLYGGGRTLTIVSPGRTKGTQERTPYAVQRIPTPLDEGFRLRKLTPCGDFTNDIYDVLLSTGAADEAHDRCDCKGHTRHGRCKHVLTLRL